MEELPDPHHTLVSKPLLQVDPKLLARALQKMQGLIRGNGIKVEDIGFLNVSDRTSIKMYRFQAQTTLKLVTQYGIRTESGRNTTFEVMPTESHFKNAIDLIAHEVCNNPVKRQQIIDFMFERSDKGFGILDGREKINPLSRNLALHEKCVVCKGLSSLSCPKCQSKGVIACQTCHGRRIVVCPRCRGSTKIRTGKGTIPCQFCRTDGKITCRKCQGLGQIKCRICAASGRVPCRPCAGTGWTSRLANIDVYAQINFHFEQKDLPSRMVEEISLNPTRCVQKHDIEVTPAKDIMFYAKDEIIHKQNQSIEARDQRQPPARFQDTMTLYYDVVCPFGSISFQISKKELSGFLFGFQPRLVGFPDFLDSLTKSGQIALNIAASSRVGAAENLEKATKYLFLKDVVIQTLYIKNISKTVAFLCTKYPVGVSSKTITELVRSADKALCHMSFFGRISGFLGGLFLFSCFCIYYFLFGGRLSLWSMGAPEHLLALADILFYLIGVVSGIFGSKFAARWSRDKALKTIIPSDVLSKSLPKAGKIKIWSCVMVIFIIGSVLTYAVIYDSPLPHWLEFILRKLK